MNSFTIAGNYLSDLSDKELILLLQEIKGGYRLQDDTARLWVAILRSLDQQGPPMTTRGIFYNCENRFHVVPKTEAGYGKVQRQVLAMRRAGVLPYSFIADHTRWIRKPTTYTGLEAYFDEGRKAYRRAIWDTQADYVEVWCEKDAIAGILCDVTDSWDVPLLVVRGYTSETFAHNAAENIKQIGKVAHIYYFGDWDKHGVRISNDIKRKLEKFGAAFIFDRVTVIPWQIYEWELPTRPSKDPNWGVCVEVDAVPANKLRDLITECIKKHIDQQAYEAVMKAEKLERQTLDEVMKNLGLAQ